MRKADQNRDTYWVFDILKICLAVLVILRHCGQAYFEDTSIFQLLITNVVSPIAVPMFFTISGFLFFQKSADSNRLKKQILRIGRLYLCWTIIYLPLQIRNIKKSDLSLVRGGIMFLQKFLFDGSYYHLWFLPSLIIALVSVYWISKSFPVKAQIIIITLFYAIGLIVDTYICFFPALQKMVDIYITIFLTTRNGLFFGAIFVYIGKWIAGNRKKMENTVALKLIIWLIAGCMILGIESLIISRGNPKIVVNMNLSSCLIVPIILLLAILINIHVKKNMMPIIRNVSTVAFCIHPWVMTCCGYMAKKLNSSAGINTLSVVALTFIMAYVCVKLSVKFKLLKYLM